MTTAVDTNVWIALLNESDALASAARVALDSARQMGPLVAPAPVFSELMAWPGRTETFLDEFFSSTGVPVDWILKEGVWRLAGRAYRDYGIRRRSHGALGPRRILTDFLIGAYAEHNGFQLLTLDQGLYRAAFPKLKIVVV
jgi:predicted nucleic acid-binding protein